MTEEFYSRLNNFERDLNKKFENSKSYSIAKDFISNKFEILNDFFMNCMSQIESSNIT